MYVRTDDRITWYSQHCAPWTDCWDVVEIGLRTALLLRADCCSSVVAGRRLPRRAPPTAARGGDRRAATEYSEKDAISRGQAIIPLWPWHASVAARKSVICWAALLHIQLLLLLPGRVDRPQSSVCFLEILAVRSGMWNVLPAWLWLAELSLYVRYRSMLKAHLFDWGCGTFRL